MHQILRKALGDAQRQGPVARNVAHLVGPSCHGTALEQQGGNQHQLRTFLDVAAGHRLGPALWLTATTGLRRGELIGLRWNDLDLDACRLTVRRFRGPRQAA